MVIKKQQLDSVLDVLKSIPTESDAGGNPFLTALQKNISITEKAFNEFLADRDAIIDKYVISDDSGNRKVKEGITEANKITDFVSTNEGELLKEIHLFAISDVDIEFTKISTSKPYYNLKYGVTIPVEDYINQFLKANQVKALLDLGIFVD